MVSRFTFAPWCHRRAASRTSRLTTPPPPECRRQNGVVYSSLSAAPTLAVSQGRLGVSCDICESKEGICAFQCRGLDPDLPPDSNDDQTAF
ncbi:hypothetical protein AAFF_G00166760 [Aldrovandia affinis]|uniref:Uncharacterized protein n=1 Tax=Aldrovandia affinis TaxID=143900 RepID=A0AAD7W7J4_9TELE|nr:hypothetical protein AAFF_G00166760 [Aldrovandia affinis]